MKEIKKFAISLVPIFLLAYFFCKINPAKSYVWYDGIWDGVCFVPNLVYSFCEQGRLYKAMEYSSGYNVCWWIFTVVSVLQVLQLASNLFPSSKK